MDLKKDKVKKERGGFAFFLGLIIVLIGFIAPFFVGNEKPDNYRCLVLGKMEVQHGKSSTDHHLILRDNKNRDFDLNVTLTTYFKAERGQYLNFTLVDSQISGIRSNAPLMTFAISVLLGVAIAITGGLRMDFETRK